MVEDWKEYKLSDGIQTIIDYRGKTPPKSSTGIPLISAANIKRGKLDFAKASYISAEDYKTWTSRGFTRPNDVLITTEAPVGEVALYPNDGNTYLISRRVIALRADEKKLHSKYLLHLLQYRPTVEALIANNRGSTVPRVLKTDITDLKLRLPPLPEQRAIASILSALDDKIELNLQMNKTLEDMAMTLYKHWFVDFGPFQEGEMVDSELGEIPKGWEVKRLDSLIDFSNGYAFKSKQLLKIEEEGSYHVFKMGHIQKGGGLKPNGTKSWIKKSDCEKLEKYILKIGDILMSMTDMKDNMTILGHTALMNENEKYIVNQRVGLLRVNNQIGIGYPFIFMLTNSFDYIERLRSQANSGVQVNLSTSAIKSSQVVTPKKGVNKKFHEMTLPLFEAINENAIENQTLTTLRDTLLPKLISGEVRVKEAEKIITQAL